MTEYDGIIIGAGHNGMILAGYLARAGLKVVAFEQALELGGGLDTHEHPDYPGFYHNIHSVFHRNLKNLPWYWDLGLEKLGIEYIRPDVTASMLLSDGRSLVWYGDMERTCRSIARFSQRDAETFRELYHQWERMVKDIVNPETYAPPLPFVKKEAILKKSEAGREYLRVSAMSCIDVVNEYFENEHLKAMLLEIAIIRAYEVHDPGLGFVIPSIILAWNQAQICKGTSHNLAHCLHKMVVKSGAEIYEQHRVKRILVEDGVARGVELHDGRKVYAKKFVASSIDVRATLGQLVDEEHLDPELAQKVKGFRASLVGPVCSVNLALREPPKYRAAEQNPDAGKACLTIIGLDTLEDIEELWQAHREGRLPERLFFQGTTPTLFDRTQAPVGKHTSFIWPCVPYHLQDGGPEKWDEIKDAAMERYLARWREYAPNLNSENIIHKFSYTPLDIERHIPNMIEGDPFVGEMSADQMLHNRPIPELSDYRTPIANLYLCGSSSHPGGNITGGPGYNAAAVIADDLGIDKWWDPPNVEVLWENLN